MPTPGPSSSPILLTIDPTPSGGATIKAWRRHEGESQTVTMTVPDLGVWLRQWRADPQAIAEQDFHHALACAETAAAMAEIDALITKLGLSP